LTFYYNIVDTAGQKGSLGELPGIIPNGQPDKLNNEHNDGYSEGIAGDPFRQKKFDYRTSCLAKFFRQRLKRALGAVNDLHKPF
jgi:hypothetical protein